MAVFKYFAVLLLALFLPNESFQSTKERSIASINVTTGYVGEPMTLRCEAPDFKIGDLNLYMRFYVDITNTWFAYYFTQHPTTVNNTKTDFTNENSFDQYISSLTQLPNTLTVYQISIVPKVEFSTQFCCAAKFSGGNFITSNKVPLVVTLRPTFTTNGNYIRLNKLTTITCSLVHFNLHNQAYSVKYFNNRDGLLATYKVDVTGKPFLSSEEYEQVVTHLGARFAYPDFDLVIAEKVNLNQSYWCTLVNSTGHQFESAHWTPVPPFVEFTSSSSSSSSSEERGNCSLDQFTQHSTTEYQVHFYSDLGPKTNENLLGYYILRPNKPTEFVIEHHSPWHDTKNGASIAYPNFEIVSKVNSTVVDKQKKNWWCALVIGQPGQANYQFIKSNTQTL